MLFNPAHANLINRGNGMIYDDVLDITWLQDTNFAQTSGYDSDGRMNWYEASRWAENLVYGGYDDWRLPTLDENVDGNNYFNGGDKGEGYNITDPNASEMGYMYYVNLGNLSSYDKFGNPRDECIADYRVCFSNSGPFINLQPGLYWLDSSYHGDSRLAWVFVMSDGLEDMMPKSVEDYGYPIDPKTFEHYAWAVRPGDVTTSVVPVPAAIWFFGSGLIGMLMLSKKR